MALTFISRDAHPNYTALSTDISANKIARANIKGATVYLTDLDIWKIIESDLTLGEFSTEGATKAKTEKYSKYTSNSDNFTISPGALNKLRLRPQIQNEHCESSREDMGDVTATVSMGQFFKASVDNINGISLTAQSHETFASMDAITAGAGENKAGTMEYSSDVALQAEYIKSGSVDAVRSAFTDESSVAQDGNWACKIPLDTLGDKWTVTLTSTDLEGVTFSLKFAQTEEYSRAKTYFFIGDGTNTKSFPLIVADDDLWNTFVFTESSMSVTANDDTVTTPTMTAITKMGFRIDDKNPSTFGYADSITYQAEGGSFDLELWDFGTTLPTGDGTEDYTSVGTQYDELGDRGIGGVVLSSINVNLLGGKRKYHIDDFIAGVALEDPDNTLLTVGNYYAIVIKYVDTNVSIFGPNTAFETDYYANGYAWSAEVADDLIDKIDGAVGSGAYSDLMFQIFSTQDVYVVDTGMFASTAPGINSDVAIFAEDSQMGIVDIPASLQKGGFGRTEFLMDLSSRPIFLEEGGKWEAYYSDDPSDNVANILFSVGYYFIPPTVNG